MKTAGLSEENGVPDSGGGHPAQSLGGACTDQFSFVGMSKEQDSSGAGGKLREESGRRRVSVGFTTTFVGCALATTVFFAAPAAASDWGCQVLLCISNPGGPMQYAACVPPITQLYDVLRSGGSFPTCTGVGFSSTIPRVEPYRCEDGFVLTRIEGETGSYSVTCRSVARQEVRLDKCRGSEASETARLVRDGGKTVCMDYTYTRPEVREQPNYVDVTIEGVTQRIWF